MPIEHPVYFQRQEKGPEGKVIVVTVVNAESLGLSDSDSTGFFVATTSTSVYSGLNPTMTFNKRTKISTKKYSELLSKKAGEEIEDTKGQGINLILRGPYWFIKKTQSILEMMG